MRLLRIRKKLKRKKPAFNRQEYKKHVKLKKKWKRPRGITSKLRMHERSRGRLPSPGFSSPKKVRGLSRSGLEVVHVSNPSQLNEEMKNKSVLISSGVGKRKKTDILNKAKELGINIENI